MKNEELDEKKTISKIKFFTEFKPACDFSCIHKRALVRRFPESITGFMPASIETRSPLS